MKFRREDGTYAWDRNRLLDIWVCNIGEGDFGLFGFATYPGGVDEERRATDGIVIDFTAFGTTGTAKKPFDLGRTATHEVGHWLDLRHIWGDGEGDDMVDDTPPCHKSSGKPLFP